MCKSRGVGVVDMPSSRGIFKGFQVCKSMKITVDCMQCYVI